MVDETFIIPNLADNDLMKSKFLDDFQEIKETHAGLVQSNASETLLERDMPDFGFRTTFYQ